MPLTAFRLPSVRCRGALSPFIERVSRRAAGVAIGSVLGASAALAGAWEIYAPSDPQAQQPSPPSVPPLLVDARAFGSAIDSDSPLVEAETESDGEPTFAGKRPTPMTPRRAAEILGWAWQEETGSAAGEETVAVLWAHWALETGRGRAMVDHNFGGLKGRGPGGASSRVWTQERSDTKRTRVRARFRAYLTAEEGARDYVRLLRSRYRVAFTAAQQGDVETFVKALGEAGYFTEEPSAYARAMQSLVEEYRGEYAEVGVASSRARG